MNNKIIVPAWLLMLVSLTSVNAGNTTVVQQDNTSIANCFGKMVAQCIAWVQGGSAGDVWKDIDVKGVPVRTFTTVGTNQKVEIVDSEKLVDLTLPQYPGDKVLYSVTFTQGEVPNKKIDILLVNLPEKPGVPMKNMQMKFLRHYSTDPMTEWTEVGNFGASKIFKGQIGNTQVTLRPDGTVVWKNPVTKKNLVFYATMKDLSKAPEEFAQDAPAEKKAVVVDTAMKDVNKTPDKIVQAAAAA